MKTCAVEGCEKPRHIERIWCPMHCNRWQRHGSLDDPRPTVEQRFWRNVQKTETCWLWTGRLTDRGYAEFKADGKNQRAHRWSYQQTNGPIPDGATLDHLCHTHDAECAGGPTCDHRRCVRPDHLEPVSIGENSLRGLGIAAENARKTHCKRGHPLVPGNLKPSKDARICLTCSRADSRDYMRRRAAAKRAAQAAGDAS